MFSVKFVLHYKHLKLLHVKQSVREEQLADRQKGSSNLVVEGQAVTQS